MAGGAAGPAAGAAQAACTACTASEGPPRQRELPRGDVMLIGGDLAYPNPTRETYEQRLFRPFEVRRSETWRSEMRRLSNVRSEV